MYAWYYGTDRQPEDRRNALAEIIATLAGFAGFVVFFIAAILMTGHGPV